MFVCFFNSAKKPGRTGTQGHSGIPMTKPRPKRCARSRKAGKRKEGVRTKEERRKIEKREEKLRE